MELNIDDLLNYWFMLSVCIVISAQEKLGGYERRVRVTEGAAESNSSFLSAL